MGIEILGNWLRWGCYKEEGRSYLEVKIGSEDKDMSVFLVIWTWFLFSFSKERSGKVEEGGRRKESTGWVIKTSKRGERRRHSLIVLLNKPRGATVLEFMVLKVKYF